MASAAPRHDHGLTINAVPNPILEGEGVLIYGQLSGSSVANKEIKLYQHLTGSGQGYTRVARTTTASNGSYEIELKGIATNRSWFATEAKVHGVYSQTVYESVQASVSLFASTTTPDTLQTVVFFGQVTPGHGGEAVLLQQHDSHGWKTIERGTLDLRSDYVFTYRWLTPGERDVRVVFPGDARNSEGAANLSETVEQPQVKTFTINSSDPIIAAGQSATISGVLYKHGKTVEPNTPVQLWGRTADESRFVLLVPSGMTNSAGAYRFAVAPSRNILYQVRTAFGRSRHTAVLFEGVSDVVSMTPSSTKPVPVGSLVKFDGTVTPDQAGHRIYLQLLENGAWHAVELQHVTFRSTFEFTFRLGAPGTYQFRARIYGDENNVGSASSPVTIMAAGFAPVVALPPAS
jgi:hypothetical protein